MKLLSAAVLILALTGCAPTAVSKLVGQPAPYTRFTMLDGSLRTPGQFRGKSLALLFWATWCPRSRSAIEKFAEFAGEYTRNDAAFIAVSIDAHSDLPVLKERIEEQSLHGVPHAFSGNDVYDEAWLAFKGEAVPQFVIIDPSGNVVAEGHRFGIIEGYFDD